MSNDGQHLYPIPTFREEAEGRASTSNNYNTTPNVMNEGHHQPGAFLTPGDGSSRNDSPVPRGPSSAESRGFANAARIEWRNHGSGVTQDLEERRFAHFHLPGTMSVQVLTTDTRFDTSGSEYTVYILRVRSQDRRTFELEHRYSQFAKLNNILKEKSVAVSATFPEKHWAGRLGQWTPSLTWAPNQHEELIAYRRLQLDVWLVHVVEKMNLGQMPQLAHSAVYNFLTHSDRVPCDSENFAPHKGNHLSPASSVGHSAAHDKSTQWNNPVSFTLGSSIRQAAATVDHMFMHSSSLLETDKSIPVDLLRHAKGLCFLTVAKAGLIVSGRVGTGLLIARIDENRWSAPCALGTIGIGWGVIAGGDITQYVVVLTRTETLEGIMTGTVQLGAEFGIAVGPIGRGGTSQVTAGGGWAVHPAYSYGYSQGLFIGMSLEGSILKVRHDVNAKFYGRQQHPMEILELPVPRAGKPLYDALERAAGVALEPTR